MSVENVESSRRVWERFLAGDMDGTLASFDPEVEVHDPPNSPMPASITAIRDI